MGAVIGWALVGVTVGFTLGVVCGALLMFLWRRLREAELRAELQALRGQASPEAMRENLRAITGDAIKDLVQITQHQFDPLLKQLQEQARAHGALKEELDQLFRAIGELQKHTTEIAGALKAAIPRGRWAEIQLQRLVELAGMREHVDVEFQASLSEGSRPDLLIHLPNGRYIVVDAKAPMDAYWRAVEAADTGERRKHLEDHARALRDHIKALSRKEYWRALGNPGPELVVLYIPGEPILSAAFEGDRELLEFAFQQRVLPATPVILLALLKAIAYGWQQQRTLENAQEILRQSHELHQRISKFVEHLSELGKELRQAVEKYNAALGSFERRVLPKFREMQRLRGALEDVSAPQPIEEMPRMSLDSSGQETGSDED
ncbi:MAG: DNA recombination protein RmuC [Thermoflexus sp.]